MRTIPKYRKLEEELIALGEAEIQEITNADALGLGIEAIEEISQRYGERVYELLTSMGEEEQMAAMEVMKPGSREHIERRSKELAAWAATLKTK